MARNDNRRSIYSGPPIQKLLELVGDETFSTTVNGSIAIFLHLMQENRPEFSAEEWRLIFGSLGQDPNTESILRFGGRALALEVQDGCKRGLDRGVDGNALVARLEKLSSAEACAVVFAASVFWRNAFPPIPAAERVPLMPAFENNTEKALEKAISWT